jgi:radical SAM superfamily enzyme YgiQ (UPF0313 family)
MKIVLAQPSYKEIYEEIGEPVHEPPLGLLYIAACLKEDGHEVEVYDLVFEDQYEKFLASIPSADYLGFSVTSPLYPMVQKLCSTLKSSNPNLKVVLGGPHVSASPSVVLKNPFVDYIIVGEGEYSMCHLVRGDVNFSGIGHKENGDFVVNPPQLIADLDSIPFPNRSFLDISKYGIISQGVGKYTTLISTRGCPYKCCFCDSHITFGRKVRFRSPENVVTELKSCIEKYNIWHFGFLDDTTTINQKRFMRICDLIIEEGLNIRYHCATRVDCVNEELLRKMKESGCYRLHIGCESGNDEILKNTGKGITIEQIVDCFKLCKKIGMSTYAYFILGLPGDTVETILKTIKFSVKINPDFIQYTIAMPFPGTDLYKYVIENDLLLKDVDYDSFKFYGSPVFCENVKPSDLIKLQKLAYSKFYKRPSFIIKQLYSIRSLNDIKKLFGGFLMFRKFTKQETK